MPKGYAGAKRAGEFRGSSFHRRPTGIVYFSLKRSGDTARVRFLQQHEDIDWARKWRMPPSASHRYGELINCIDQHEDGTNDPGYAAQLRSTFKAYPTLIWRNAVQYARDQNGRIVKDGLGNFQIAGYADQVAVWECSFKVYNALKTLDAKYGGLMGRDFTITRQGIDQSTEYIILPEDPTPITAQDQQIAAQQRIDTSPFVEIPDFQALSNYIHGGGIPSEPQPSFDQQVQNNQMAAGGFNPFSGSETPQPPPTPPTPPQQYPPQQHQPQQDFQQQNPVAPQYPQQQQYPPNNTNPFQ